MSGTNTSKDKAVPNHPTPTFGNPDLPPQGRVNTEGNPESLRSDGPRNEVIESQFPSQVDPPATDISTQPFFWSSFNISPKRIQNGGWARELTSEDFAISDRDRRRQHAPGAGRHPRIALAPDRRVGRHDARKMPHHHHRRPGASQRRGRRRG